MLLSFANILEQYYSDSLIMIEVKASDDFQISTNDHVTLFKVGWFNINDGLISVDLDKKEINLFNVTIDLNRLSIQNQNEFYQLCYISSNNRLCGISSLFQILQPESNQNDLTFYNLPSQSLNNRIILENLQLEEENKKLQNEIISLEMKLEESESSFYALKMANESLINKQKSMIKKDSIVSVSSLKNESQIDEDFIKSNKSDSNCKLKKDLILDKKLYAETTDVFDDSSIISTYSIKDIKSEYILKNEQSLRYNIAELATKAWQPFNFPYKKNSFHDNSLTLLQNKPSKIDYQNLSNVFYAQPTWFPNPFSNYDVTTD